MSKQYVLKPFEKKMLYFLDRDSSMNLKELAKKLNTSPQRVDYTIRKLLNFGIIKELITIIDYKKLGYTVGFVYYELKSMSSEKYEEMLDYCYNNEDILVILEGIGEYDLSLGFFFKDLFELNEKISEFKKRFNDHIYRDVKVVHIGARRSFRDYLFLSHETEKGIQITTGGRETEVVYRDVDIKILSILSRNSRATISEISKNICSNTYTVSKRIKYLKENKIIVGATFVPDLKKYEYQYYRLLIKLKTVDELREKKFFSYLVSHPNVVQAVKNFGEYSMTVDVEIEDIFKLREFTSLMIKNFGYLIDKYDIMRIYNIPKFCYFPSRLLKKVEKD